VNHGMGRPEQVEQKKEEHQVAEVVWPSILKQEGGGALGLPRKEDPMNMYPSSNARLEGTILEDISPFK